MNPFTLQENPSVCLVLCVNLEALFIRIVQAARLLSFLGREKNIV